MTEMTFRPGPNPRPTWRTSTERGPRVPIASTGNRFTSHRESRVDQKPRNPREMRVRYSFVIDQNPRFLAEGELFLRVLLAAGVAPQDIVAQTTVRSG